MNRCLKLSLPALVLISGSTQARCNDHHYSYTELQTVSASAAFFGEPLRQVTLDILNRALKDPSNSPHKTQAAALLYRYGSTEGLAVLRGRVAHGDSLAALVLAGTLDEPSKKHILRHFAAQKKKDSELALALGAWRDPIISAVLKSAYDTDPANPDLALALARQGNKSSLDALDRTFKKAEPGSLEQAKFAVALATLDRDGHRALAHSVDRALETGITSKPLPPGHFSMYIIDAANYAGGKEFRAPLQRGLETYLNSPARNRRLDDSGSDPEVVLGIEYFLNHGQPQDKSLLTRSVGKRGNAPNELWTSSLKSRAAAKVIKLDPVAGAKSLATLGPPDWLADVKRMAALRETPRRILSWTDDFDKYLDKFTNPNSR